MVGSVGSYGFGGFDLGYGERVIFGDVGVDGVVWGRFVGRGFVGRGRFGGRFGDVKDVEGMVGGGFNGGFFGGVVWDVVFIDYVVVLVFLVDLKCGGLEVEGIFLCVGFGGSFVFGEWELVGVVVLGVEEMDGFDIGGNMEVEWKLNGGYFECEVEINMRCW